MARADEVAALVGPNGCGKSTALKAMSRVMPLMAGEVQAGDIYDQSPLCRAIFSKSTDAIRQLKNKTIDFIQTSTEQLR